MPSEIRLYRTLGEARGRFGPSAVTIGNFDGVHRGHQALFDRLPGKGAKPSVITFDPHPSSVVAPDRAPKLMSTLEQRVRWMRESGIEQVLVIPFDDAFSRLDAEAFARTVLVEAAGAKFVAVGSNFRFGRKAGGDTEMLSRLGRTLGFDTEAVDPVLWRGIVVSSTEIRRAVESGAVHCAARLLGRPFTLEGDVVSGHGVGSKQTVPTLNLAPVSEVLPASGVYISRVRDLDSDRRWPAVTNAGTRPTFAGDRFAIESFILEGFSDPSPSRIGVDFLRRIRDEKRFADAAELKVQILRDAANAAKYHGRVRDILAKS
jgi:riboflavin kinase/FMN adenylyltransferase